jgi:hypothetical protein
MEKSLNKNNINLLYNEITSNSIPSNENENKYKDREKETYITILIFYLPLLKINTNKIIIIS